jgi:hypothetical protein
MAQNENTQAVAEQTPWTRSQPYTSQEFMESLRDGREILI